MNIKNMEEIPLHFYLATQALITGTPLLALSGQQLGNPYSTKIT